MLFEVGDQECASRYTDVEDLTLILLVGILKEGNI